MDFGTIKMRLNSYYYKDAQPFYLDLRQVFRNCIKYNGKTTNYGRLSYQLLDELERLIDETNIRKYIKKQTEVDIINPPL